MFKLTDIGQYKENNRIEAKKALGGLPDSIWETYSAFANTVGGYILLGVEEYADRSLHPIDLPDPEMLVEDFWSMVNDKKRVSANILTDKDVTVENVDGKRIVLIRVPPADVTDKPVYIDRDPLYGSYYRSGESDLRYTEQEVLEMLAKASEAKKEKL